jgi:HEAT repeat protein
MAKRLHKGDEARRRANIIAASRSADENLLPQLLAHLGSDETQENRRHIIRALGNIGGQVAEDKLLQLLQSECDLALGDVIHSLGKLKCHRAISSIKRHADHPESWVRQNVEFALEQFEAET